MVTSSGIAHLVSSISIRKLESAEGLLVSPDRVVEITFEMGHGGEIGVYPREEVAEWVRKWLLEK